MSDDLVFAGVAEQVRTAFTVVLHEQAMPEPELLERRTRQTAWLGSWVRPGVLEGVDTVRAALRSTPMIWAHARPMLS